MQVGALDQIDVSYIVSMYTPHFPLTWESIVLLLASILLALIVTAKLDLLLWHATHSTGKLLGELYIIVVVAVKTCFACTHFLFFVPFLSNLLLKLSPNVCQHQ